MRHPPLVEGLVVGAVDDRAVVDYSDLQWLNDLAPVLLQGILMESEGSFLEVPLKAIAS